ncbi:MAG TPA: ADOP family duplicated permease [Vicinamibacterales bacterium]|nr:ADOP family duplicated permease [Vicinamibacterales bacterium]
MPDRVPRLARWILRLAAGAEHRDALLEDLAEEAADLARASGPAAARRWIRRQALASLRPLLLRRAETAGALVRNASMNGWRGFGSDLSAASRRLRDTPGFTLVCVLTLALGIGGNTAVFTLIDRVLLKPLPVPRPAELYRVGDTDACCVNSGLQGSFSLFSYDLYTHLRDAAPQFTGLAAFQANTRTVTIGHADGATPPETLNGAFVSGNYFQMFELVPAAGRLIHGADDERGAPVVAVLSHNAWTQRFQSRADAVGRRISLNGVPATIVGVAPRGFYGESLRPDPPQIWMAIASEPLLQPAAKLRDGRGQHWLYAIGRLKPDTAIPALESQLTATLRQWLGTIDLSRERGEISRQTITVIPAAAGVDNLRNAVAPTLRALQWLAGAVLLIACANLASLLLARGTARRTETAVRVALGASRFRLIGQFLLESILLACAGGAAGLAVSYVGARVIINLAFRGATDVPVDPTPSTLVVLFAFGASLVTGALFGAAPAIVGSRTSPIDALRGASRIASDRGGRLRGSLIALQVALSLVLITCAGLLGRSLQQLELQDFGVAIPSRYVVTLAPSLSMVTPEELPSMYARMQEQLARIPGVVNAAFSLYAPMSGDNWSTRIVVEGRSTPEAASWNRVSPRYFETVGTPLLRGRALTEQDRPGSPLVAVVTQAFAARFFGTADPIGRRIGQITPEIEIVGVVADAKYQDGRRAPREMFFLPYLQETSTSRTRAAAGGLRIDRSHYPQAIVLQTAGPRSGLEADVRRVLADVDRRITVRSLVSMEEQVARAFSLDRLTARLTLAFGAVALLLACLGLYGVTAYSVARRTREIGVRMAVGASRGRVVGTILRSAIGQVAAGVAIGMPLTLMAGRILASRLFGVTGHDPLVIAAGLALLGVSAAIAALLPAARAATMDPVRALRIE